MSFLANISAPNNHPSTFRLGITAGFLLYSAFGILDYYMLPSSYIIAWKIRFFLVGPSLILPLIFSYYSWFHKYLSLFTNIVLGLAQVGILLMIFYAKPFENAYYDYYVGLVLVILWAAFIFKVNYISLLVFTFLTWVIYIFYMVEYQQLLSFGYHTPQFAAFFNNSMFLISITSLAVLGNYLIDKYYSKLLEEKKNLQLALKRVQESDQMKSNFLSTMSHEIRTPLNGIIGFSNIMINEDDYEQYGEMAQVINRQGLQLLSIVDFILKYTEIQSKADLKEKTKIEGKDLIDIIYREFDFYKNKLNNHDVTFSLADKKMIKEKSLFVYHDPFIDIIKIQLENAIKFSNSGEIKLHINMVNESGLLLKLEDAGIGIDKDQAPKIFDNFFQIESGHNRRYEGIGLGLSYAKKIVELMGGTIWYEKNMGEGSSFYTHIPDCVRHI